MSNPDCWCRPKLVPETPWSVFLIHNDAIGLLCSTIPGTIIQPKGEGMDYTDALITGFSEN